LRTILNASIREYNIDKGGVNMANTSAVYARIDTELKENAEEILAQLGISPSSAIQMLYSQIVLKRGMPFDLRLPSPEPLAAGVMTREQLDAELQKGVDSIKAGKVYSADEVDAALSMEFGI
jgi:DNA-damage-inducible protein J